MSNEPARVNPIRAALTDREGPVVEIGGWAAVGLVLGIIVTVLGISAWFYLPLLMAFVGYRLRQAGTFNVEDEPEGIPQDWKDPNNPWG